MSDPTRAQQAQILDVLARNPLITEKVNGPSQCIEALRAGAAALRAPSPVGELEKKEDDQSRSDQSGEATADPRGELLALIEAVASQIETWANDLDDGESIDNTVMWMRDRACSIKDARDLIMGVELAPEGSPLFPSPESESK